MAVKFSRAAIAASTKALLETVNPADAAKLLLENANGTMFYLVVGDKVVCWSENRDEIIAASEGKFRFSLNGDTPPVPVSDFREVTVSGFSIDGDYAERLAERNRRVNAAQRYRQRFLARHRRICETLGEMLKPKLTQRDRIEDIKALNRKHGLAKVQNATTTDQLNAYGALIGSWKLKEKAGIA